MLNFLAQSCGDVPQDSARFANDLFDNLRTLTVPVCTPAQRTMVRQRLPNALNESMSKRLTAICTCFVRYPVIGAGEHLQAVFHQRTLDAHIPKSSA
jgi:hypothetical protein